MTTSAHRRRILTIVLGVSFLVLVLGYTALNAFQPLPSFLTPETTAQVVAFTAISALAFLLLVGVLVLLVRNLLKLYADQKSGVMGSRLRTRMLWGAILVSLVPISFMFFFSYELMNRSVDRWFSGPASTISGEWSLLDPTLADYTTANARAEAESIAAALPPLDATATQAAIERVLRQHQVALRNGFAVVFRDGKSVASLNVPHPGGGTTVRPWLPERGAVANDIDPDEDAAPPAVNPVQPVFEVAHEKDDWLLGAAQRTPNPVLTIAGADFSLGMTALTKPGNGGGNIAVVAGLPLPAGMWARTANLRAESEQYGKLQRERRSIRSTYMILLTMMTVLALFASTWLALHLSKQVTKPVESLADAMAAIAAGDYGHRVEESATEELGELVRSFNHMAADLDSSRAQVEASTQLLSAANAALEARRGELETMLQTIPNGVATIDAQGRIVLTNRALTEMLDPGGQQPFVGRLLHDVFPAEVMESLDRLMRRSHRMGSASGEMEMETPAGTLNLAGTVALLEGAGTHEHLGYVIVLEDATELLRAQKQSAWKEVARRVAHEIKNPLTPISLSAEQIGRHIERLAGTLSAAEVQSPSVAVIRRCSEVITASVESMRGLVDQFAALAQFPTAMPRPADLNTIVENSLAMFAGRTQNIKLIRRLELDLPLVMADPEAMKRALGNLVDNAVEAMQDSLLRELRISTAVLPGGMVELTVADTGAGLTDEMRERLFLPYFSTKQRGTGLGLAIAAKIVQEHGGTIRAEKNEPAGAKFIVELRAASMADTGEHRVVTDAVALAQD